MEDQQEQRVNSSGPEVRSEVEKQTTQIEPQKESGQNRLLIVGLVVVLILVVAGVLGYMIFSNQTAQRAKNQPTDASPSPVVSQTAVSDKSISTSSSGLSKDDSVETLKKELNQTSIDNFSSDLQGVERDINAL